MAPGFKANFSLKRAPTVALDTFDGYSNTVLENVVRVLSGQFQYKLRPFLPFFNVDDSWLPTLVLVRRKTKKKNSQSWYGQLRILELRQTAAFFAGFSSSLPHTHNRIVLPTRH